MDMLKKRKLVGVTLRHCVPALEAGLDTSHKDHWVQGGED